MKYVFWLENEKFDWDIISLLIECELFDIEYGWYDFFVEKMVYVIILYFWDKYDQVVEDNKLIMNEFLDIGCLNGDEIQFVVDLDCFIKDEKYYFEIFFFVVNYVDR